MYAVYFLQSQKKEIFYIGVTRNIESRLHEHNSGNTKSTKPYRPWVLIYKELYVDKIQAYKREYYLKHPKGYKEKRQIVDIYHIPVEQLGEVA